MTIPERACPACGAALPAEAQFCMQCGRATPTEPGVPARTMPTGEVEVARVRRLLADRYRIERIVGEGGMATVFLAEDLKHRRQVALKVMRPELAATLGSDRFLREVGIAARLNHPHVLPMYDSGSADGMLYYVMPYVEGESLHGRLARLKQLPTAEAVRLAREIAEAVAYAHRQGIVHRDLKPANILLGEGHALVADFGIARVLGTSEQAITRTGFAIGTPQYMSPEQAMGSPDIDGRSDVYAIGAILYEMLAGEPPFAGPTPQAILARSLTETARPVTQLRPDVSPAVAEVIATAMARDPAARHADAAALRDALAALEGTATSGATAARMPLAAPAAARPRWIVPAIAAAVVVVLGGGWFAMRGVRGDATATASEAERGLRVAVLPFSVQGEGDDAVAAEGIIDEVRGKLSRIKGFTVLASTSTELYRNSTKSPQEIAKELGADVLLTGRVRWIGTGDARRVQVVPEVIDGTTGTTKWQDSFEGGAADLFAVQSQIASRVAGALGAALGQAEEEQLAERPTESIPAWNLYLRARAIVDVSAQPQRERAALLEQAVALDSTFAEAWALLAQSMTSVYGNGSRDPVSAQRAKVAMERALALKPNLPAAHLATAGYYTTVERNPSRAEAAFETATRLDPDNPRVVSRSAGRAMAQGKVAEALALYQHARELDPRSAAILGSVQTALVYAGQHDEAIDVSEQLLEMERNDLNVVQWQAIAHVGKGDLAGARRVIAAAKQRGFSAPSIAAYFAGYLEMSWVLDDADRGLLFRLTPAAFDGDRAWWGQALAVAHWDAGNRVLGRAYADSALAPSKAQVDASPEDSQLRALYAVLLAYVGRGDEAVAEATRALELVPDQSGNQAAYEVQILARVNTALGRNAAALDALERLVKMPWHTSKAWLAMDPAFTSLRNEPRFKALIAP
ncbi:MAG TPA: protein kinase [Gemmatimonadales bacterium]|nr:protein kinase [Gemmatimonadales bacterium]